MYAQAVEVTHLSESALQDYVWVANAVDYATRNPNLSWTHHRIVARLSADKQALELREAQILGYSTRAFASIIQAEYPDNGHTSTRAEHPDTPQFCPTCGQPWPDDDA
jgi:hypothetical protein